MAPTNNGGSPITGYKIFWDAGIIAGAMLERNANHTGGT